MVLLTRLELDPSRRDSCARPARSGLLAGFGFSPMAGERAPERAIRGFSSLSCAARSTGCPPSRRRRSRLCRPAWRSRLRRLRANTPVCRSTGFSRPSLAFRLQAPLRCEARGSGPRRRDRLPRPLPFRRPGRARERLSGAWAHRKRLAQSDAERVAAVGRCGASAGSGSARRRRSSSAARRRRSDGRRPGGIAPATGDLAERVLDLYAHRDPALGQRLSEALAAEKVAAESAAAEPDEQAAAGGPADDARRRRGRGDAFLPRPTDRGSRRSPSTVSIRI